MTFPKSIIEASKILFNMASEVGTFNDKARRMDNPDYDINDLLKHICEELDRRELSADNAARRFVSGWVKSRTSDNEVAILRDAYTTLYISIQQRVDPWLVTPDVRITFERFDFMNGDFVISFT